MSQEIRAHLTGASPCPDGSTLVIMFIPTTDLTARLARGTEVTLVVPEARP